MIHFLDASVLAKRYIREPGSDRVAQLFRKNPSIGVSRLTLVEVTSALTRRARHGDLDQALAEQHVESLRDDFGDFEIVEPRAAVLEHALKLVEKHALRAHDAVQLASALRFEGASRRAVNFMCADGELVDAAEAEGLRVETVG